MSSERPDLAGVSPEVRDYIEALENELAQLRRPTRAARVERSELSDAALAALPAEPSRPPTTLNLVTISAGGIIKRTPRHIYDRQHRGGMGIFDLDTPENDPPIFLSVVDQSQALVLVTNQGRAFRLPLGELPESPIRPRGVPLGQRFSWLQGERLSLVFPDRGGTYLVYVTERGQVRRMRHHYFGANLAPGTILHDVKEGGAPVAACWTSSEAELFIVTRKGDAIRFTERQVPVRGCLGLRVDPTDVVVSVASVTADSGVFLIGADGKGTIRLIDGFTANKAPGSGGKVAIKTERLIGAGTVRDQDDLFIISKLGKIIRFRAVEVPAKEGVVQGVNCMALRADEVAAVTVSQPAA